MNKHNQDGAINVLLLPLIISIVILIGVMGFAGWAYSSRQTYKNHADIKISAAETIATNAADAQKDKQYAALAKLPNVTYDGPEQLGSLKLQYPKTWSAYVNAGSQLDAYFNPGYVPSITDLNSTFALRVKVIDRTYDSVVSSYSREDGVTVEPYMLPKLPKVVGLRIEGQIEKKKQGVMVLLPVRDKTIQVYTESPDFQDDFDNTILANLTFSP